MGFENVAGDAGIAAHRHDFGIAAGKVVGAAEIAHVGKTDRGLPDDRDTLARAIDPQELEPIRARIAEQFGYQARFTHFPIVGTCPDCLGSGEAFRRGHSSR